MGVSFVFRNEKWGKEEAFLLWVSARSDYQALGCWLSVSFKNTQRKPQIELEFHVAFFLKILNSLGSFKKNWTKNLDTDNHEIY
jgi:hypothetical protein